MPGFRRVLVAFLASPGDLADERRAAKEVVDEVSQMARGLGITLELLGWEDTLPGAQRPQDAINRDLDTADLFIGLLWRRWGQPTGHPQYTSGFEEEFLRASARRNETDSPEMWLFFKDIEPAQRQDPGDQLQKVLAFRERCTSEKKIFFKEFANVEAWTKLFRQTLSTYVVRLSPGGNLEPVGEGLDSSRTRQPTPASLSKSNSTKAPSLLPLVDILRDLANGEDPAPLASKADGLHSARLYLLGLSMLAHSGTSSDVANTHELNTLFRLRTEFDPIPAEQSLLMRTVLSDEAGVKPGWFWFPQEDEKQLSALGFFAFLSGEAKVARGALRLLTRGRVRVPRWETLLFNPAIVSNYPVEVRDAFYDYLEAVVTPADQGALEALLAAGGPERTATALLIARAQSDPSAVLAELASFPNEPNQRVVDWLSHQVSRVDSVVLKAAFSSRHSSIREAVALALTWRDDLDDIRAAAQSDPSESIRVIEYRNRLAAAIESGSERPRPPDNLSYTLTRTLGVERLAGLGREQLNARIDWFDSESPEAYQVLATEHWDLVGNQVRQDLRENFERIRDISLDRLARQMSESMPSPGEAAEVLARKTIEGSIKEKTDRFIRGSFATAALEALKSHGVAEDLELVRPFLDDTLDRHTAVATIARVATIENLAELIGLAEESTGDARLLAADAALRLSGQDGEATEVFLRSGNEYLVERAVRTLETPPSASFKKRLLPLLDDEHHSIRAMGARALARHLPKPELLSLLNAYFEQPSYYYNVVTILDGALHCRIPEDHGASTLS